MGIGAYSFQFSVFWHTFSVKFLSRGGGGSRAFAGKARGVRRHALPRKVFKMVQFGAF